MFGRLGERAQGDAEHWGVEAQKIERAERFISLARDAKYAAAVAAILEGVSRGDGRAMFWQQLGAALQR